METGPIIKDVFVHNIAVTPNGEFTRASITGTANGKEYHAWYDIPNVFEVDQSIAEQAFAFMTIGLGHAFGGVVDYPFQILPETRSSCDVLYQLILKEGIPMQPTSIKAPDCLSTDAIGTKTASFFSGGVDSMYCAEDSLTKNSELIFIIGVDMRLDQNDIIQNSVRAAKGFSEEIGKQIHIVKTNVKETMYDVIPWHINHGFIMATIAFLCRKRFWKVFIPSSLPASIELFHGSAGFVIPHYSTRYTQLVVHGPHVFRVDKVRALSPLAMKYLRCCYESDNLLNCSSCEKCLRTLVILCTQNKLDLATTFKKTTLVDIIKSLNELALKDETSNTKFFRFCTWRELIDFEKNAELANVIKNLLLRTIPKHDATSLARSLAYETSGEVKTDHDLVAAMKEQLNTLLAQLLQK